MPVPAPRPSLARALALRFAVVYWSLFCVPVIATQITGLDKIGGPVMRVWNAIVVWVGEHVLGISYPFSPAENGSGDKTSDWVGLFCIAATAAIAAAIWTALDRRRRHDARLHEGLRVLLRYSLALVILGYGIAKLFLDQFPSPSVSRLDERYGDSSPMGLLWTFMGASPAYVFFSGAAETLGAALLLFRRTTTLGALVLGAVLTNIVLLNFCYDVPVKINSSHYLAMCGFLLLPDLGRLADVLVFHRPTQPAGHQLVLHRRWMRIARIIVKVGLVATVAILNVRAELADRGAGPNAWYEGYWHVTAFARDGHDVAPVETDATRWRWLTFEAGEPIYVRSRAMNGSYGDLYEVAVDEPHATMTWTPSDAETPKHATGPIVFHYERLDPTHLELDGVVGPATLSVRFERLVAEDTPLMSRGFRWINDEPYNR